MKLPTTKQELLDKVRASHRKLGVEAATIPASHYRHTAMIWQEPRLHTNAAMVLVDVIVWNTMILQFAHDRTPGPSASFYSPSAMAQRAERLPELAADLVRQRVDVILAGSVPGALAAKNATTTIPTLPRLHWNASSSTVSARFRSAATSASASETARPGRRRTRPSTRDRTPSDESPRTARRRLTRRARRTGR